MAHVKCESSPTVTDFSFPPGSVLITILVFAFVIPEILSFLSFIFIAVEGIVLLSSVDINLLTFPTVVMKIWAVSADGIGVGVAVNAGFIVAVGAGVFVAEEVGVGVGVCVGVLVGPDVGVVVGVRVGDAVGVLVGVNVGVGVEVLVGVGVGVFVGDGVGVPKLRVISCICGVAVEDPAKLIRYCKNCPAGLNRALPLVAFCQLDHVELSFDVLVWIVTVPPLRTFVKAEFVHTIF